MHVGFYLYTFLYIHIYLAYCFMRLFIFKLRLLFKKSGFVKQRDRSILNKVFVPPAQCIVGRSGRASGGRHVLQLEEVWQSVSHRESFVLGTGLSFCRVRWRVSRALGSWCTAADTASGSRCGPRQTHTGKSVTKPPASARAQGQRIQHEYFTF